MISSAFKDIADVFSTLVGVTRGNASADSVKQLINDYAADYLVKMHDKTNAVPPPGMFFVKSNVPEHSSFYDTYAMTSSTRFVICVYACIRMLVPLSTSLVKALVSRSRDDAHQQPVINSVDQLATDYVSMCDVFVSNSAFLVTSHPDPSLPVVLLNGDHVEIGRENSDLIADGRGCTPSQSLLSMADMRRQARRHNNRVNTAVERSRTIYPNVTYDELVKQYKQAQYSSKLISQADETVSNLRQQIEEISAKNSLLDVEYVKMKNELTRTQRAMEDLEREKCQLELVLNKLDHSSATPPPPMTESAPVVPPQPSVPFISPLTVIPTPVIGVIPLTPNTIQPHAVDLLDVTPTTGNVAKQPEPMSSQSAPVSHPKDNRLDFLQSALLDNQKDVEWIHDDSPLIDWEEAAPPPSSSSKHIDVIPNVMDEFIVSKPVVQQQQPTPVVPKSPPPPPVNEIPSLSSDASEREQQLHWYYRNKLMALQTKIDGLMSQGVTTNSDDGDNTMVTALNADINRWKSEATAWESESANLRRQLEDALDSQTRMVNQLQEAISENTMMRESRLRCMSCRASNSIGNLLSSRSKCMGCGRVVNFEVAPR